MSTEIDKEKHSKRIQQKTNHVSRQMDIRKAHAFDNNSVAKHNEPHRYHKVSGTTCGNSNCVQCGNPRKFFGEPTQQEKRLSQDIEEVRAKRSNGVPPGEEV